MGIFRANPKGRVFPGGLLCQEARQGDRPLASLPFAHSIPESLRRNPVEFFNSLLILDGCWGWDIGHFDIAGFFSGGFFQCILGFTLFALGEFVLAFFGGVFLLVCGYSHL